MIMMIYDTWWWYILLNMFNLYADVDAKSMTPSRNTRSYTLQSVPSSPGRSFFEYRRFMQHMAIYNTFIKIQNKHICCPPAALSSPLPPYAPYESREFCWYEHMCTCAKASRFKLLILVIYKLVARFVWISRIQAKHGYIIRLWKSKTITY